jgi:hypothetical protein
MMSARNERIRVFVWRVVLFPPVLLIFPLRVKHLPSADRERPKGASAFFSGFVLVGDMRGATISSRAGAWAWAGWLSVAERVSVWVSKHF